MSRHDCAIWLAERPSCNRALKLQLLERFGTAQAVYDAEEQEYLAVPGIGKRQIAALGEKSLEHAERILSDCARQEIRVISIEDEDYPTPLRDLPDAPTVLYVRGTLPDWNERISIGMVGTRRATEYGLGATRWLAAQLAREGCVIVSGMALGIDGQSSRGALDAGGITVAVLGSGVDVCYPASHRNLMKEILVRGAVISEYPPGTGPERRNFPERNRIISGLCRGLIVIEAPKKSGSLITADLALSQGRDIFAVPGNINSPQSQGTNRLLREGAAELVTCAADVLAHYAGPHKKLRADSSTPYSEPLMVDERKPQNAPVPSQGAGKANKNNPSKTPEIGLTQAEQRVLEAVRQGADGADAIIEATGLTASQVLSSLTMLEINRLVRRSGASYQAGMIEE